MSTTTTYSLLPVTRIATTPRAHADITIGFSKHSPQIMIQFIRSHQRTDNQKHHRKTDDNCQNQKQQE